MTEHSHRVDILSALPGCGKSYWTKRQEGDPIVVSADHFFEEREQVVKIDKHGNEKPYWETVYNFNPAKLGQAHADCMSRFVKAINEGQAVDGQSSYIILDNTNTQEWEYRHYTEAARMMGYHVRLVQWQFDSLDVAKRCFARQSHGVPLANWMAMWWRFERKTTWAGNDVLIRHPEFK